MTDLIQRLRHDADTMCPGQYYDRILNEAASRIEQLERELAGSTALTDGQGAKMIQAVGERDALRARVALLKDVAS